MRSFASSRDATATATAVATDEPARGGIILVGRFIAIAGLNYGFGVALAWLLAPGIFGEVAVIQAVLWLVAMTANSGFPWTLARTLADRTRLGHHVVDGVFRTSVAGNLVFGLVLSLGLFALQRAGVFTLDGSSRALLPILMVTIPFLALNSVGRGALHGLTRFGALGAVQTSEVFVKCIAGLALVGVLGMGAEGVALGFLLGAVCATGVAAWFLRDEFPGTRTWARLSVYRETAPMFAGTLGLALLLTVDVLGLKALSGRVAGITATTLALYQVAAMLARTPYFVADAMMDAVFPFMVRRHDSAPASHAYLRAALRWVLLGVLPVEVILIVSPQPLLHLLFPLSYAPAVPLVRMLALGSIGALGTVVFGKGLQALGRRTAVANGMLVSLAVECAGLAILVPRIGAIGAAAAFATGAWSGAAVLAVSYSRHQRARFLSASDVRRHLVALVAIVPAGALAARRPSLTGLAFVLAGILAYGVALRITGLLSLGEVRRLGAVARSVLPMQHAVRVPREGPS